MYRVVVAAINEHLNSEISARYAMDFAKACGARFYVCFIAGKGMSSHALDAAENALKRTFEHAVQMGLDAVVISETGLPEEKIPAICKREKADILFISTRHEDVKRRFYAGSLAFDLSKRIKCAIAIVRIVHAGRAHPREILVPLKARISRIADRAYFAAKMAEAYRSKIILFHATRPITKFFHGDLYLAPAEWESRRGGDMPEFIERISAHGVTHEGRTRPGAAGRAISMEAAVKRHDLIIMGSSERSFVSRLLRGNPIEHVIAHTPCNLIIFRPRHED